MTAWNAVKRATVLIPSGPNHDPDRKHLHIVVTDPTSTTGDVLIVCVSSIPTSSAQGYDTSCTLFPGEHPFVVKDSFVAYRFTRIVSAQSLEEKVAAGEYVAKEMLNEKQFEYVVTGLRESPYVASKYLNFFQATQA